MKAQDLENMAAQDLFERAMADLTKDVSGMWWVRPNKQLRRCSADVYESPNFYILRSYNTFIGAIEKATGYGSDMLRHEYGYTATSAQHLSKFFTDYGDRQKVYRWYN